MTRKQLLLRLLLKAAWVRKDRALTALISVAVAATIATAALTVYYDLESKLSREFRNFGANVVVTQKQGSLSADELKTMEKVLAGKGDVVPVAYAVATASSDGSKVVVGGADLEKLKKLNSWWAMTSPREGFALLGSRAEERLSHGSAFAISFSHRNIEIRSAGTFRSGSDDESRIYVPLNMFTEWTGQQPGTALVRVEGRPREIEEIIARLTTSLPAAEVKPVRQITREQTAVVGKTRSVVLAASLVVLVMILLSIIATLTSSVLERRKDFAVMKALGASNPTVNFLFAAEASILALAGAAAGYVAGSAVAFWIGKVNFEAAIVPQPALLLPVLLGSVVLALIAAMAPLRILQQIQPAGILRGE
ncbi:MAG TPA: FtsX-like permease family protein [Candidatus Angelobacter sp.]